MAGHSTDVVIERRSPAGGLVDRDQWTKLNSGSSQRRF
jgi:hypothetical protein